MLAQSIDLSIRVSVVVLFDLVALLRARASSGWFRSRERTSDGLDLLRRRVPRPGRVFGLPFPDGTTGVGSGRRAFGRRLRVLLVDRFIRGIDALGLLHLGHFLGRQESATGTSGTLHGVHVS